MGQTDRTERAVLIYAPIGRDGRAVADLLRQNGISSVVHSDLSELVSTLRNGAGTAFIAEEGLSGDEANALFAWVEDQPKWSDLPFIILTSRNDQPIAAAWRQSIVARLRNVSLLERPVQAVTLVSSVQAALRAREHQYEVRSLLEMRERSAQHLQELVAERTRALEETNEALQREMAERTVAEETLRQAQKIEALGQLTGGVAHDFNNLLMVIIAGIDMLGRRSAPEDRHKIMEGMRHAAMRGATLVRQLLAFSRRQQLRPEIIDVAGQITGMREILERSLRGDIHVELLLPQDLWPVEADPGELELMVLNLCLNARDAMPMGGTITVRADNLAGCEEEGLNGDFVHLSISDTGVGMTPEVRSHVFEPFFTTKEIGKGSGLGLAQVHGFAVQSGGAVRIHSEVGKGTTVSVLLPRSQKVLESAAPPTLPELGNPPQSKVRAGCVLLVEDDEEVSILVTEMLEQLGFQVLRTASAEAALGALANGRKVDLVFSDVMMPGGMDGVELAREIRARRSDIPVLLTSGYAEAARKGADEEGLRVLPKPYGLSELAAALQATIDTSARRSAPQGV